MQILLCSLFIIANLSYNSKASHDSFTPFSDNSMFEDSTKNSDIKSCNRPCKFNVKPRRCYYEFKIEPTIQDDGTKTISVNGITPGPPIHVCVGDVVIVQVKNKIPDQDVALHWHGVEQKGTPYMDGVPMITQCPVSYGSTYKYAFRASAPGTFFYHSDSVSHQSDGVFGSLIVSQPAPLDPHSQLYDFDRSNENTLVFSAKFPQLLTSNLEDLTKLKPISLLVNGDNENTKIFVMSNYAYRVRLINAIAIECPIELTIDKHEMLVIAGDGKPVQPVATRKVKLYPGERMDVVVRASQDVGGYWIRLKSSGACATASGKAMFLYTGFNYTSMLEDSQNVSQVESEPDAIYGQKLQSHYLAQHSREVKSFYLGIDKNIPGFRESDNDYRYISDALPKKPFFPASLSLQENGVVQINRKSFLYPSSPLLLNRREDPTNTVCNIGEEYMQPEPQCLLTLNADEGETLELALVNEGFNSNDSYTFHMHGFPVQVLATWQNPNRNPVSKTYFDKMDEEGKIIRETEYPPLKDTVVVPNKGYTIIRIKAEQRGTWLLECRSCSLSSLPTAVVINVPITLPKSVSDSLPKCGNYRPPDVLLN